MNTNIDSGLIGMICFFIIICCSGFIIDKLCSKFNHNIDEHRAINNNIVVEDEVPPKYEDIIN
jgi:hypothetical protein